VQGVILLKSNKMSKPKRHHYISQFYLAGFTSDGTQNGQIYCFDLLKKESRKTKVRDIGFEKYFNRIDAKNLEEDFLEKEISKFESHAAEVFRKIISDKNLPSSEIEKRTLYEFMASLAVRNPSIRKSWDDFKKNLLLTAIQFYLTDENTWNNYKKRAADDGVKGVDNLSYRDARKLFIDTDWKMISHNNDFVKIELPSVERVANLLSHREWTLFDASNCFYNLITSDRPVKLFWNDSKLNEGNIGPGFAMKKSELFFPISKSFLLMGSYERQYPKIIATDEMVTNFNVTQFYYTDRYLFSPTVKFYFEDAKDKIRDSDTLLNAI